MLKIESQVPFGHAIYAWLYIHDIQLNKLTGHDQTETRYLAWETVRIRNNPYFEEGTGFEGYLVGRCAEPEAALEEILGITQNVLDSITRRYRNEYNFSSRLMKTLTRERYDAEIMAIWSANLGTALAKLRAQMLHNPDAQHFQNRTYQLVNLLPPMAYHTADHDLTQTYNILAEGAIPYRRLHVTASMLNPGQQDAWLVAQNIGEFGHPLVRKYLERPYDF